MSDSTNTPSRIEEVPLSKKSDLESGSSNLDIFYSWEDIRFSVPLKKGEKKLVTE